MSTPTLDRLTQPDQEQPQGYPVSSGMVEGTGVESQVEPIEGEGPSVPSATGDQPKNTKSPRELLAELDSYAEDPNRDFDAHDAYVLKGDVVRAVLGKAYKNERRRQASLRRCTTTITSLCAEIRLWDTLRDERHFHHD